jgi:hypothetical protein
LFNFEFYFFGFSDSLYILTYSVDCKQLAALAVGFDRPILLKYVHLDARLAERSYVLPPSSKSAKETASHLYISLLPTQASAESALYTTGISTGDPNIHSKDLLPIKEFLGPFQYELFANAVHSRKRRRKR